MLDLLVELEFSVSVAPEPGRAPSKGKQARGGRGGLKLVTSVLLALLTMLDCSQSWLLYSDGGRERRRWKIGSL